MSPRAVADLADVLGSAVDGVFPEADGGWQRGRLWRRGVEAVVSFTGHAYLAVAEDLSDVELEALGVDGFGGAHHPHVAERIRGSGWADTLDVLLLRTPTPSALARNPDVLDLVERDDLAAHPRVAAAQQVRSGIRVLGLPARRSRSLVTIADGVGGLPELGIEAHGEQSGRQLLLSALQWCEDHLDREAPLVAAVAPGNARSMRLFLRTGFVPVGSVQLFRPERHPWAPD
ncbi:MAG TPA: N-acetyltransferase [Dermatophilaceae bacterium]|nr:N-acetyltransferase [Dermatophilaceae bacterium]